jgi:HAD superfamily hydrolase (TIGR01490 family)
MSKILVVFDFCDTIITGQSVSLFLNYLYNKESIIKKYYLKVRTKLNPFKLDDINYKSHLLRPYKGLTKKELDIIGKEFYNNVLKSRFNKKVISKLKFHKERNHKIIIISGGFDVYLKYFAEEYQIELISTKLEFKDNEFTGRLIEQCLNENKIKMLKSKFNLKNYDMKESFAYSDSKSDKDLLSLFGNVYVIKIKGQALNWIKPNWKIIEINE